MFSSNIFLNIALAITNKIVFSFFSSFAFTIWMKGFLSNSNHIKTHSLPPPCVCVSVCVFACVFVLHVRIAKLSRKTTNQLALLNLNMNKNLGKVFCLAFMQILMA